ncbi:MAG: TetR/AcrR family transcriptional regulator [Collinsella sp.]|nr:TetR/AcrR family transcriptional regulator [Collinsella sp.]
MPDRKRGPVNAETRECIATAMIKLVKDKPLGSISITELCRTAGVSRMAFYRNYTSKEDVLESRLDELIVEYRSFSEPPRAQGGAWNSRANLIQCLLFLKSNKDFLECLYRCGLTNRLLDSITQFLIERWGDGTSEGEYALTAFTGALCTVYVRWAIDDFMESPHMLASLLEQSSRACPRSNS